MNRIGHTWSKEDDEQAANEATSIEEVCRQSAAY
jgi:hypothetical protein